MLKDKTALEVGQMIKNKEIKAKEVLEYTFDVIRKEDSSINAFITLDEENAYIRADKTDEKISKGEELPPLAGVPVSIKDSIVTKGLRTTAGSKILENYIPPYNATVMDKIEDNGLIVVGKTNMDEFSMGNTTENSFFGVTKNPYDVMKVAGGSSGGSCANVSYGGSFLSLGSDTGGSIRQPASFCSVVGLKPTYGRVSRYGLIAYASSLEQIGPVAKNVQDCESLFNIISGWDKRDLTTIKDFREISQGKRIGIDVDYFENTDNEIKDILFNAVEVFKDMGYEIIDIKLPYRDYLVPCYYIIACGEASSNLSRYDGVKYGYRSKNAKNLTDIFYKSRSEAFGDEVKRRIMLGSFILSKGYYDDYYLKALKVRRLIKESFERELNKCDVIISPVTKETAYKIGDNKDIIESYKEDVYTVGANLAGIPSLSIPCGFTGENMPVGIQLMGRAFSEKLLFKIAGDFERGIKNGI